MFGDCEYVKEYLHTSPEAKLFLLGVDEDGKSALSLAACEKYPPMIKLLVDPGANPDHQNEDGRTSLMEAALWGRIENVHFLLELGADRKLRDIDGHQAADLARPSVRNDKERYQRSGRDIQVYRENYFIANQARRVIFELLKGSEEFHRSAVPTYDGAFETHTFKNTGRGTVELNAPIAEFPVLNEWKTIASLQRPPKFPPIAAMSGWSHGDTVTVSGKEWTAEVMRISLILGHQLQTDERRDQGNRGQCFASHAEKQLMAYFISKHVLIENEDEDRLFQVKPPVLLKQATILVSRPLCGDCVQFIQTVNTNLGLMISVLDRSERRKGTSQR